jgi:hypothetical protein
MSGVKVDLSNQIDMNLDCDDIACDLYTVPGLNELVRSGADSTTCKNVNTCMSMTSIEPGLFEDSEEIESEKGESDVLQEPSYDCMENYKRHGRAILSIEQAQAIFQHKPKPFEKERTRAGNLAKLYGISVKTVRDIWVGRTWYRATFHLDEMKPLSPERLQKKAGRPKGAKDSKPRMRKNPYDIGECQLDGLFSLHSFDSGCEADLPKHVYCDAPIQSNIKAFSDGISWLDFPMGIHAAAFEDPFREDWEQWQQQRLQTQEPEFEVPIKYEDEAPLQTNTVACTSGTEPWSMYTGDS